VYTYNTYKYIQASGVVGEVFNTTPDEEYTYYHCTAIVLIIHTKLAFRVLFVLQHKFVVRKLGRTVERRRTKLNVVIFILYCSTYNVCVRVQYRIRVCSGNGRFQRADAELGVYVYDVYVWCVYILYDFGEMKYYNITTTHIQYKPCNLQKTFRFRRFL